MENPNEKRELTVCFWNILSDVNVPSLVEPQSDRLHGIITSLGAFPNDSVVGLAEVEITSSRQIANAFRAKTVYFVGNHREGSQVGVVSRLKLKPKHIELGKDCRAIIVEHEGINVVFVHATLVLVGDKKRKVQINNLMDRLDLKKPIIIMGDFNSMYWQGSRRLFKQVGFTSAFKRSLLKRIPTAPTRNYRKILPQPLKTLGYWGFTLDDAYVKGLDVLESSIFEGESDHRGLVVKVQVR